MVLNRWGHAATTAGLGCWTTTRGDAPRVPKMGWCESGGTELSVGYPSRDGSLLGWISAFESRRRHTGRAAGQYVPWA